MGNSMLVCGDRNWGRFYLPDGTPDHVKDREVRAATFRFLDSVATFASADVLIEGCARGADRMAEEWATTAYPLIGVHRHFPADWDKYGRSAGPIRNQRMLDEGRPDLVVALHDNLSESRGTAHMVRISELANIPVYALTSTEILNANL